MLIAHKAVELSKVKAARRKVLSQPGYLDQNYIAQPKYDGCFAAVFVEAFDVGHMESRTGEQVQSCDHIVRDITRAFPAGMVVFGEVWKPMTPQSEISGKFRRQSVQEPDLQFVVFDCVTLTDFVYGFSEHPYTERFDQVWARYDQQLRTSWCPVVHYNPGTYGNYAALRDTYLDRKGGGYDGLILRDPNAPWILGTGTGGEIIKAKRVLSFDLEVLGVNEGTGKMKGMAGTLTLRWKNSRTIEAGGLDYLTREAWFLHPESIIGKIVEVEAMDYSTDGLLREPRIKGVRFDKDKADY